MYYVYTFSIIDEQANERNLPTNQCVKCLKYSSEAVIHKIFLIVMYQLFLSISNIYQFSGISICIVSVQIGWYLRDKKNCLKSNE